MNELLSGKIMSAQRLSDLLYYLGITNGRKTIVSDMRSTEGLTRAEKQNYKDDMRRANLRRNKLDAFFDDKAYVNNVAVDEDQA